MDKETLSNYGWIVICVLVLAVMLALATPFGEFVRASVQSIQSGFFETNTNALAVGIESVGLSNKPNIKIDQELGISETAPSVSGTELYISGTVDLQTKALKINEIKINIDEDGRWETTIIMPQDEVQKIVITATNNIGNSKTEERYALNAVWQDFSITAENRHKVGYTGAENEELVVPATFFDEEDMKWCNVTQVNGGAFEGCTNLKSVILPNSITTIWNNAFSTCTNMQKIILPNNITRINSYTFYKCESLKEIILPKTVTHIGNAAFRYCGSLEHINIPENVTTIENICFSQCYSLKEAIMPDSVTTLGANAFYECQSLEKLKISPNIKRIEKHTFEECDALTEVVIPEGVEYIGYVAFARCNNLKRIVIADSVTEIYGCAFYDTSNLEDIHLGKGLTYILPETFTAAFGLKTITIPENITYIYENAFLNSRIKEIHFEDGENWKYKNPNTNEIKIFDTSDAKQNAKFMLENYTYIFGKSKK